MLPLLVNLGFCGVLFSVGGTMFDKYLLERYFGSDDQGGPGALIIFYPCFRLPSFLSSISIRYAAINFSVNAAVTGLLAGGLNGVWLLMYLHAMIRADVSRMAPLFQAVPVFGLLFGETFWLSIGYMIFGAALFLFVTACRHQFLFLFGERRSHIAGVNIVNEVFDNTGELVTLAAVVLGPVALLQAPNADEPMLIFLFCLLLMRVWPRYFQEDISTSDLIQKACGIAVIFAGSISLYQTI